MEESLIEFSEAIDIDIDISQLLVALYGTLYLEDSDPNGMYILYNRNKIFAQVIKSQYPYIYRTLNNVVIKFRNLLNLEYNKDKSNYLLYILFTNWQNLLVELYEKYQKVSILVISDRHYSHAKTIKNRLSFELGHNINIDNYENRIMSPDILQESKYDFIITTFKLPSLNGKTILMVDDYLTDHDIFQVRVIVDKLIKEKQRKYNLSLNNSIDKA